MSGSCVVGCDSSSAYSYNVYMFNSVTSQWTLFANSSYYYTSGQSNTQLTLLKQLFTDYPSQIIWKVELIVNSLTSVAGLNQTYQGLTSIKLYVNFAPLPGLCYVSPTFGNTSTLFYITCNSWTDPDGSITSYSFYGKKKIYFNYSINDTKNDSRCSYAI